MFKKNLPLGYGLITATPPAIQGFTNIRLGGQESIPFEERTHGERIFLRDLFSNINGEYFLVDPTVSPDVKEGENVIRSPLGDGGKVLPAGKSIIVTQDLWTDPVARKHLMMLRAQGYKAAYVPFVDKSSQPEDKRNFVPNHIDGHAVLLLDQDQNPHFLYARSYAKQAAQVSKALRSAADYVGAVAVEVNDQGLPFLAFNMLQLRDGSVVISASRESQALIEAVEKIVGKENTLVTSEPIEQTPLLAKGAIRCMANSAPFSVIQRFNPVITNSV